MDVGAARNTGICNARGAWVSCQNSDDEWMPRKLDKQMMRTALLGPDCVLRLVRLGPVAFVDEPLVRQYFSENSITHSHEKRAFARERIVEKSIDFC
jgi:glycosyltransferase involved in cell wall biosynthesis